MQYLYIRHPRKCGIQFQDLLSSPTYPNGGHKSLTSDCWTVRNCQSWQEVSAVLRCMRVWCCSAKAVWALLGLEKQVAQLLGRMLIFYAFGFVQLRNLENHLWQILSHQQGQPQWWASWETQLGVFRSSWCRSPSQGSQWEMRQTSPYPLNLCLFISKRNV